MLRQPAIPTTVPPSQAPGKPRDTWESLLDKPSSATGAGLSVSLADIPGQITAVRKFLRSLGTGSAAGTPTWDTLALNDVAPQATATRKFLRSVSSANAWDTLTTADLADVQIGTFTVTLTGCTTSPTGVAYYTLDGNTVTLMVVPDTYISGTSNSISKTLTGMPALIRPNRILLGFTALVSNSGNPYAAAEVDIHTDGTIQYYPTANGGSWVASGTAALGALYARYSLA